MWCHWSCASTQRKVTPLSHWPGSGLLCRQVLTTVQLLTPHHYRHIHYCVKIHSGGVKKTDRLFPKVTGQDTTSTNSEIQGIQYRNKKKLLYRECSHIGTGCLERLASASREMFKTQWEKVLSRVELNIISR